MEEKLAKDYLENISNNDKTNISFQSDNIFLEKTLTSDYLETAGSISYNWFDSSSQTN